MKKQPFRFTLVSTRARLFLWISLAAGMLLPQVAAVQNYQDYQTWSLPNGAIARLGKGRVRYPAFSPDGSHLAVVTFIGAWLYDVDTGRELALLTGHTGVFAFVVFSPDGTKSRHGQGKMSYCRMLRRADISPHS